MYCSIWTHEAFGKKNVSEHTHLRQHLFSILLEIVYSFTLFASCPYAIRYFKSKFVFSLLGEISGIIQMAISCCRNFTGYMEVSSVGDTAVSKGWLRWEGWLAPVLWEFSRAIFCTTLHKGSLKGICRIPKSKCRKVNLTT